MLGKLALKPLLIQLIVRCGDAWKRQLALVVKILRHNGSNVSVRHALTKEHLFPAGCPEQSCWLNHGLLPCGLTDEKHFCLLRWRAKSAGELPEDDSESDLGRNHPVEFPKRETRGASAVARLSSSNCCLIISQRNTYMKRR